MHIIVLKMKVMYYMLQVPARQYQNDIYFFACFVIIALEGISGLGALDLFFSAGCKIWREHISVSPTLIVAPLSRSPQ